MLPMSKLRHFSKQFFRTASEILFTDIKLYCCQGPIIQNMLMIERSSGSKGFKVTAHFSAISQAKTECKNRQHFTTFLTPAPHSPTLKQKTGDIKHVIISNCTKFLKYPYKILLLEIIQNTSSTTRYFF